MRSKILLFTVNLLIINLLYSCVYKSKHIIASSATVVNENIMQIEMDSILHIAHSLDNMVKCKYNSFAYFDFSHPHTTYYRLPYNGCLYNPKIDSTNDLGWGDVVIIPKKKYISNFSDYSDYYKIDSILGVINNMDIKEIKNKFNILIFLIPKQYLEYMKDMEIEYWHKNTYLYKEYYFNNEISNYWNYTDSLFITTKTNNRQILDWLDNRIKLRLSNN